VPVPSRLHRPLVAAVLGAALLVPLSPAASASPAARPAAAATKAVRATQTTLTAYGDADGSGRIHLSGSVRWATGARTGHQEAVELWGRSGTRWVLVRRATTDKHGEVELDVVPGAHTTYRLHYVGTRAAARSTSAAASTSASVKVRAVGHVTLATPAKARRGVTFVVTGTVVPGGAGHVVTLTGDGRTFTTLRTRADGSFSGHVRLQRTTTLSVVLPDTATVDGAVSGPHAVRVS